MRVKFERIIIGATTTGLGAFFSEPENCLLIEPTSMIGSDFAGSFYPGSAEGNLFQAEASNQLFQEATKIGVLKDGFVHLPGLQTLMYKQLVPHAKNVLFLTDLISAESIDGEIAVTVFNRNGTTTYTCNELIDATALMITNQIKTEIKSVSLGCIFISTQENVVLPVIANAKIYQSCFANEFYFHLSIDKNESWAKARKELITFIAEQKNSLEGWALAASAIEKNVIVSNKYKGIASVLNPSQYDGIVAGFTAGINFFENRKALV